MVFEKTGGDTKARTELATVFIVDDDSVVRKSISILARSVDLKVEAFSSAQEFLDSYRSDIPGCLILDVRMPGMSGLELQQRLVDEGSPLPIIMISAHAELSVATQAIRTGAIDFIQKSYSPQLLLDRIHEAIKMDAATRREQAQHAYVAQRVAQLSNRKREIMKLLAQGLSTKKIASALDISPKTVDNHRASILEKLEVDNVAKLVRLVINHIS